MGWYFLGGVGVGWGLVLLGEGAGLVVIFRGVVFSVAAKVIEGVVLGGG